MDYLLFIVGLAALIVGGEVLVRGAVDLAGKLGLSPLFIGLTIVSFGTSAPELIVSLNAAPTNPALAVGNVVGSNVANLALVLGLTALVRPLPVERVTLRWDWPVMLGVSGLLWLFVLDGDLANWEGGILLASLIGYIAWTAKISKASPVDTSEEVEDISMPKSLLFIALGCVGLAFGAEWLVDGAIGIATSMGIDERQVSSTVVAFGTSVPELVTSLVAAFRGQSDISVGNLIGSNLFNIALILGLTSVIQTIPFSSAVITGDMIWVMGVALVTGLLMLKLKVSRVKGALLFLIYIGYVYYIF